jgi:hypothetical protein
MLHCIGYELAASMPSFYIIKPYVFARLEYCVRVSKIYLLTHSLQSNSLRARGYAPLLFSPLFFRAALRLSIDYDATWKIDFNEAKYSTRFSVSTTCEPTPCDRCDVM